MIKKIFLILTFCASVNVLAQEINLGIIAPLTGESAYYGNDLARVSRMLVDEFNEQSSVKVNLVLEDGKCGAGNAAMSAAKKLVEVNKIAALVVACSGEVLQAGTFLDKAKVPTIATAASVSAVRDLGPYIFRTYADLRRGIEKLAQFIQKRGDYPLAILTEEASFTMAAKDVLEKSLKEKVTYSETFEANSSDVRALVTKAMSKNPKAFYLSSLSPKSYQLLVKQLRQLGFTGQIYSYFMPGDKSSLENLKGLQEGALFVDTPDQRAISTEYAQFLDKYKKRFLEGPTIAFLNRTAYDSTRISLEAIKKYGDDREQIKNFITQYQGQGAVGTISFDETGDIKDLEFAINQIINGAVVNVH